MHDSLDLSATFSRAAVSAMQQADRGNRQVVTATVKQKVDRVAPRVWRLRYSRYGEDAHLQYMQCTRAVHRAV
jgi:hypothetical protein